MIFAGGGTYEFFIERAPLDATVGKTLGRWNRLARDEGWDVTALVDEPPPGTHLIGLGVRYNEDPSPQGCD